MKRIETITSETFSPYGKVLAFSPDQQESEFEIIITEETQPWRLAVFRVKNTSCTRLECHATSLESFEPVSGIGVLLVAPPDAPQDYRAFLLDQSVCLYKGVWHAMVTLSPQTIVKIAENLSVESEFYELSQAVGVSLGSIE